MTDRPDLLGHQIRSIRIVDIIGEGGMGSVYTGFDQTLQRKVAVKAIRGDHRLSAEAKSRFLREARVLSQLDHPGICRVHDYIEDEENDYLVLELIEGRSLREAMSAGLEDADKMGIARQLLEVLVAVHDRGVVHRDLKPENVMLTEDGTVKVLDFGLARSADEERVRSAIATVPVHAWAPDSELTETVALGPEAAASSQRARADLTHTRSVYVKTQHGMILGTLGYMSPEQARGESATAASDMYSLGLILQEMFTGVRPFEEGLKPETLLRRAQQGEARAIVGLPADLTTLLSRMRSSSPGARPSSVDVLAQLHAILDKPRRRRRRMVVVCTWVILALFAAAMGVQSVRVAREAGRAEEEAETAQQVAAFLVGMFDDLRPEEGGGTSLTTVQLLDLGSRKAEYELRDQPVVQAELMKTLAQVYADLDLPEPADALRERALETLEKELGADDPHLGEFLSLRALGLVARRDYEQARLLFQRALQVQEELGPEHPAVADTLLRLASLERAMGNIDEERRLLERCLRIREDAFGSDHPEVVEALTILADHKMRDGLLTEAEQLNRRVLSIRQARFGLESPEVAESLFALAAIATDRHDHDRAEELYSEALAIQEETLGPYSVKVADTLEGFAALRLARQEHEEARRLYERCLAIREKTFGPGSHWTCRTLVSLGKALEKQGEIELAREHLERALVQRTAAVGEGEGTTPYRIALGEFVAQQVLLDEETEEVVRTALRLREAASGPDSLETQFLARVLLSFYIDRGGYSDALAMQEKVVGSEERSLESWSDIDEHQSEALTLVGDLLSLGRLQLLTAGPEEGWGSCERARSVLGRLPAAGVVEVEQGWADVLLLESLLALRQERRADAATLSRQAVERLRSAGESFFEPAFAASHLLDQGDRYMSDNLVAEARRIYELGTGALGELPPEHFEDPEMLNLRAWMLVQLGRAQVLLGMKEEARKAWKGSADLLSPVWRESESVDTLDTYAKALLLLRRADDARPVVNRLLDMGWRDEEFLLLCRDLGLLEESDPGA